MHEYDKGDRRKEILSELRRVAADLGKTPTVVEFKRANSRFSYEQVIGMFGSWNAAVEGASLPINPTLQPPSNKVSQEELIAEFIRVANKLGRIPPHPVFSANATFSRGPYERTFGSWRKAVTEIASRHADRFKFPVPSMEPKPGKSGPTPILLPRELNVPLLFVPRNEMETLVLFSLLAPRLGYEIQSVQIEFPDLTIRKGIELIPAEVEYQSSTYLDHGHPINERYMCICWRKDKDITGLREILSLETFVRSLPNTALNPAQNPY